MYFDPTVKEKLEDFYNYTEERKHLEALLASGPPMIVIKGLRRTGKTSLMRVCYSSLKTPKAWIDGRQIFSGFKADQLLYEAFTNLLKELKMEEKIFARISSLSFTSPYGEVGVSIGRPLPGSIAEEVNKELENRKLKAVLFIDEAQIMKKEHLDRFLAYMYDNITNVKIVISGSQTGVLEKFIGKHNAKAPLFGRVLTEITMVPLSPEKSADFLMKGFEAAGKKIKHEDIEDAVKEFDGLMGWLTYYGYYRLSDTHESAKAKVFEWASEIVKSEIASFLSERRGKKERYLILLKILSEEPKSWEELSTAMSIKTGKRVSDSRMQGYITTMEDYSFISKQGGRYVIPDPVVGKVVRKLSFGSISAKIPTSGKPKGKRK